jgi:mannitol-specific phosphotransferase system IIBC component
MIQNYVLVRGENMSVLGTIGSILLTLTVTFIFNKVVGIPKILKEQKRLEQEKEEQQKKLEKEKEEQLKKENEERDAKIKALEEAVSKLPKYREQSLEIQTELKNTDKAILDACKEIKNSVLESQNVLNSRLDRLEKRDKNSIRAKLLAEHRLFTDPTKNPMLAWSEMEHHAFFEQIEDYEALGGNDYVHSDVIPDVNKLVVVPMSDKQELLKLMNSRKL